MFSRSFAISATLAELTTSVRSKTWPYKACAAKALGNPVSLELRVSGVCALGRKSQKKVRLQGFSGFDGPAIRVIDRSRTAQPRPLQDRQHDIFGGSRVGCTLEHDKL